MFCSVTGSDKQSLAIIICVTITLGLLATIGWILIVHKYRRNKAIEGKISIVFTLQYGFFFKITTITLSV